MELVPYFHRYVNIVLLLCIVCKFRTIVLKLLYCCHTVICSFCIWLFLYVFRVDSLSIVLMFLFFVQIQIKLAGHTSTAGFAKAEADNDRSLADVIIIIHKAKQKRLHRSFLCQLFNSQITFWISQLSTATKQSGILNSYCFCVKRKSLVCCSFCD